MFSNHITLKKVDKKKATISGHFGFVFEENLHEETIMIIVTPFSNCFPYTAKRKAGVFKFPSFKERFRSKALFFRYGLVWTVGLTVEKKGAFSYLSRVWPQKQHV